VLLLAVDASGSMNYASAGVNDTKLEYAALLAAVLAYSAALNGDKVGLLLYGRKPHFHLPPAKGMKQCRRIVREILSAPAAGQDDTIDAIATEILCTQRKRALVFMISDFLAAPDKKAIGKLNFRHELVPICLRDPAELQLPEAGVVRFRDPESGELYEADLSDEELREEYTRAIIAHGAEWRQIFNQLGIDAPELKTTDDFIPALRNLFHRRSRKITR